MAQAGAASLPPELGSLRYRNIGPHRGGRVVAVHGDPRRPYVFYFGACAGGVWKTDDAGLTWRNISDGDFRSAAVGALAVSSADPNVLYAGMGEACIRGNVCGGDGVYRSTDGGRSWRHAGLAETRHISRIRVHPDDPDTVYVGALGHAFGPNPDRGVFRSRDGGRSWQRVLHRGDRAGCADLRLDPTNPRILYAAMWEAQRGPHFLNSGGPGSGLWKSADGGDTWVELSRNPGLPAGVLGRIGVAVSPRPGRLWAIVEAEQGGLFRSEDAGASWQLVNDDGQLRARPFYYMHIFADPCDAERLYVLNFSMWRSTDGGRSFTTVATPHGDNHDLWIDPTNPDRMIEGNDGGACVSLNGGRTWSSIYNQPTAQFYHVTADTRFPYRVYGAQQDNMTISVPSRSDLSGIGPREWYDVGGAESGYIAVRPDDPDIVYAGSSGGGEGGRLTRYDHRLRQQRDVTAWPQRTAGLASEDYTYRFQWTSPIHLCPHDPGVLYSCANRVFRSRDEGASWELISPDLTRDDKSRQGPSGGPITKDHTGVEVYCTIFAFAESPVRRGVLWAGSDDGLIHVSRDDGASWENVTPAAELLPEWALISIIEPSAHDPAVAYVAATRYKHDDPRPYLLRTADYGKTWRAIAGGIPEDDFTRVIREDPVQPGLLFCGTESGVHVSVDDGANWMRLQLNLPVVPIHDLIVKDGDLVLGTHGRSFWILDDVTPLRQWAARRGAVGGAEPVLFAPRPAHRFRGGFLALSPRDAVNGPTAAMDFPAGATFHVLRRPGAGEAPELADAGQNPPPGALIHYYLPRRVEGELTLTVRDAASQVIRTFRSRPEPGGGGDGRAAGSEAASERDPALPAAAGSHRFVWDLRAPAPARLADADPAESWWEPAGPFVVPGRYTLTLAGEGVQAEQALEVRADPRVHASATDLQAQYDFLVTVRDRVSEVRGAVDRIRAIYAQLDQWIANTRHLPAAASVAERAEAVRKALAEVEGKLAQPKMPKGTRPSGTPPRLEGQMAHLLGVADSADAAPTRQTLALWAQLDEQAGQHLARLQQLIDAELLSFEAALREAGVPAIAVGGAG